MYKKYRIITVLDRNTGEPRLDEFYPEIIGEVFKLNKDLLEIDVPINLYGQDANLRTSRVMDYTYDGSKLVIETMNSVYHLEKVNED